MADLPKFDWSLAFLNHLSGSIALAGRLALAYVFIVEGRDKIADMAGTAAYMQSNGVDPRLLPLVIATELGGGLMVVAGLGARWAAIALAGFCGLTALLFHNNGADADQVINFQKNVAIGGDFLLLAAFGPGAWSLEALLGKWRKGQSQETIGQSRLRS
jgi:putative oxidoreductase